MSRPSEISTLDCLSFLYVCAMAHDGEVTGSESNILIEKIHEWEPGDQEAARLSVAKASNWWVASFEQGGIDAVATEFIFCLANVKGSVEDAAKRAILGDLAAIFEADGKVTEGEQGLYDLIRNDLFS